MKWWEFRKRRHCPHVHVRGIYGDEINATPGFRRVQCLTCGRLLDGSVSIAVVRRRAVVEEPAVIKDDPERSPCKGFQWIGQSWEYCDGCGQPYWEHDFDQKFNREKGPFDDDPWLYEPISAESKARVKARYLRG